MDHDLETIDERHSILKDWKHYLPRHDSVLGPPPEVASNWYFAEQDEEEHAIRRFVAIAWSLSAGSLSDDQEEDSAIDTEIKKQIKRWRLETEHTSLTSRMVAHPSYLSLIRLGGQYYKPVVKCLLKELRSRPDYWFAALEAITGEHGFSNKDGDFDDERRAWLKWGREKGYL